MTTPAVKAAGGEALVWARRLAAARTLRGYLAAVGRGLGRFFVWYRGWLAATDKAYLIENGASALNKAQHNYWCYWRRKTSQYIAGAVALILTVMTFIKGVVVLLVFAVMMSAVLALIGRKPDKPIVTPRDIVATKPRITADFVQKVVASATEGMKADDWESIKPLGAGVVWDADRVWWTCKFEMPGTVPGENVRKAKAGLMSGFGVGDNQLEVLVDPTNGAVVTLHGTQEDPWAKPPLPTPLAGMDEFNIWEQIPLATDARGRRLFVSVVFTGWVVGAIPRRGKTNLVRLLALAAALDPFCDLIIFDLKGAKDWRMFEALCRHCGFGRSDAIIKRLAQVLEAIQHEITRRGDVISSLPDERCPSGQLTRDLALDRELDLAPLLVIIDEVQFGILHRVYGKKISTMLEDIAKTGQFVGIWLVLATQKPDSKSIPTNIRDVLGTRAALKCKTRQTSEAILGTEAYKEGWDAATLPDRAGIAILYGGDDEAGLPGNVRARIDLAEIADAKNICVRAEKAREALGRLPRQRRGSEPVLIEHARQLQGEQGYIPAAELLVGLNRMPEYADTPWTQDTLGKAMRAAGATSFKMNKNSTGDPAMPEHYNGRMGYKILTRREEITTL